MIYACSKIFNAILSSSEELHKRLEAAQRYIFLKTLSRQRLENYSTSVNYEVLQSYESFFFANFFYSFKKYWTTVKKSHINTHAIYTKLLQRYGYSKCFTCMYY